MKKLFTLLVSALLCTFAFGQGKEAVFPKAGAVKPVIDGVLDDVWTNVEPHSIAVPFKTETATEGPEGTTYWKAMWAEEGIYVIVVVNDNVWSPYTGVSGTSDYNYDRIEMYFDTNFLLEDGKGGQVGTTGNRQLAPNPTLDKLDGEMLSGTVQGATYNYAFKVENPAWNLEMFVPWDAILDKDNNPFDKTGTLGFDVQVTDNDDGANARNRVYWSNAGGKDESWNNMDDAGHVTLEGAGEAIDIETLTISGDQAITTDNGTVQLSAVVMPTNATQAYKWVITEGAINATVSSKGVVTALRDGVVKVEAVSMNEYVSSNEITINISGQKISLPEINILSNGDFTQGTDGKSLWGGSGTVADGYYNLECTPKAQIWDNMFGQQHIKVADATTKYFVRFNAKGSAEMAVPMLFEDRANSNDKVVSSSAAYRDNGYGKWDVPVTTEEQTFLIDVVFSNKKDNSDYELNFQAGMVAGTFSLSNIMMYSEADYALVDKTGVKTLNANASMNVYPNPVSSTLNVELKATNAKVAIYNSLGQKITEKTATGNKVTFDVSGLQKGMYFVKTSDGATQKFIR